MTTLTNAVSGQSQNCSGNLEISPGIGTKVLFSLFISAGKSFEKWEIEDICAWLTQIMLKEHCGCFRENQVSGSTLLSSLKDRTLKTDLKDIGVKALGKSLHFIV